MIVVLFSLFYFASFANCKRKSVKFTDSNLIICENILVKKNKNVERIKKVDNIEKKVRKVYKRRRE